MKLHRRRLPYVVAIAVAALARPALTQPTDLPSTPMAFGAFTATFSPSGTFSLQGEGWPPSTGTWKDTKDAKDAKGLGVVELLTPDAAGGCDKPARYAYSVAGSHVTFTLVADDCVPRRMILD